MTHDTRGAKHTPYRQAIKNSVAKKKTIRVTIATTTFFVVNLSIYSFDIFLAPFMGEVTRCRIEAIDGDFVGVLVSEFNPEG